MNRHLKNMFDEGRSSSPTPLRRRIPGVESLIAAQFESFDNMFSDLCLVFVLNFPNMSMC